MKVYFKDSNDASVISDQTVLLLKAFAGDGFNRYTHDVATNPNGKSELLSSIQNGIKGIINQWGGNLAFFFTYIHFSHDLTTGLLVGLLPFIRQDLGLNYLQSGFLVSAFSLTAGFSQIFGGWLSDRIEPRKAIALGLGGVGLSAASISFAPSYYAFLALLVALGILSGFYHPSAVSIITNHFEPRRLGRVIALHQIGGSLGFGIGPFVGAIISSRFDWHLAYLILGLPALVAALLVITQLKVRQSNYTTSATVTGKKPVSIWQVFRSGATIIAISVSMQLVTGPIMSFIPLFLVDVHNLTESASSLLVTVIRMAGLCGSLFGGWLTDKWGRRNTIFLALSMFGPVVFLLTRLHFGIGFAAVLVAFGWLMSMRETTMQTYLMENTPPQLRATVFGIYFGFGQQGSSIIQPVAGDFMDMIGIVGVYNAITFISVGLSVLAVIAAIRSRRIENSPHG